MPRAVIFKSSQQTFQSSVCARNSDFEGGIHTSATQIFDELFSFDNGLRSAEEVVLIERIAQWTFYILLRCSYGYFDQASCRQVCVAGSSINDSHESVSLQFAGIRLAPQDFVIIWVLLTKGNLPIYFFNVCPQRNPVEPKSYCNWKEIILIYWTDHDNVVDWLTFWRFCRSVKDNSKLCCSWVYFENTRKWQVVGFMFRCVRDLFFRVFVQVLHVDAFWYEFGIFEP